MKTRIGIMGLRLGAVLCLIGLLGAVGCRLQTNRPDDEEPPMADPEGPPAYVEPQKALTIGDVEAVVHITGVISRDSVTERFNIQELKKPSMEISLVRAEAYLPHPKQLWVEFTLSDTAGYRERPVVLRGNIVRQNDDGEKVPLEQIASILGLMEQLEDVDVAKNSQRVFKVDVLADLEAVPETMLVSAEVEALLMPEDTEVKTLDPLTAEAPEYDRAMLFSNPIRINFKNEAP